MSACRKIWSERLDSNSALRRASQSAAKQSGWEQQHQAPRALAGCLIELKVQGMASEVLQQPTSFSRVPQAALRY